MKGKQFRIPGLIVRLPRLWTFSLPLPGGIYLGGGKLIVASLSTVALGFLASMFILISSGDQEITWPMLGASVAGNSSRRRPRPTR